jgi:general secretion pathway protein H
MTSPADRTGPEAGYTLFELMVVLAIMGLMLGLVVTRGPLVSRTLTMKQAASQLAGALREARSDAIGGNRRVAMNVDVRQRTFAIDGRQPQRLRGQFGISMLTTAGEVSNADVAGIGFEPDGSSTGGRIVLDDTGHKIAVGVDWLNGRVSVVDAP